MCMYMENHEQHTSKWIMCISAVHVHVHVLVCAVVQAESCPVCKRVIHACICFAHACTCTCMIVYMYMYMLVYMYTG